MALPAQETNRSFRPEEYPNDFHICSNKDGKIEYGGIIHNIPFYIIGEGGKETEIARYDVCTKCRGIISMKFNKVLNSKYLANIHRLFTQNPTATFFYKDEVLTGQLDMETMPKEGEGFNDFKKRFREHLIAKGYYPTKPKEKPLKQ